MLKDVSLAVFAHLAGGEDVAGLTAHCAALHFPTDMRAALDQPVVLAGGEGEALLLAYWANSQIAGESRIFDVAALQPYVDVLTTSVKACIDLFGRTLGAHSSALTARSRSERLRQALRRAGLLDDAVI